TVCSPPEGETDGETGSTTGPSMTGSSTSTDTGSDDASTSGGPPAPTTTDDASLCDGVRPPFEWPGCGGPVSEVFEQDGECCMIIGAWEPCCEGRPFFVDDVARTAEAARREDWSAELLVDVGTL